MKKKLAMLLLSIVSAVASAAPASTTVTFSNGTQGWAGVGEGIGGSWISGTPGKHGAAYYSYIPDTFGLNWVNRDTAWIGDYSTVRSVTIGIDVKANSITYQGREVERHLVVELRDYDNPYNGMPYTSVWYNLGPVKKGNWKSMSVTIADTKAASLPAGWGGTGSGGVALPPGRTFADVLAGVDEIAFTTFVPGMFYGWTTYDVAVDNISIKTAPR
ncbi:hypothetical protein [Massilia niastensis]|uniref:hypothetical protein n=1 Tax=Massilia niastensis TaxID=544911 RepID=UPI000376A687|nr:hypothetical protein [Massilia niastensis]